MWARAPSLGGGLPRHRPAGALQRAPASAPGVYAVLWVCLVRRTVVWCALLPCSASPASHQPWRCLWRRFSQITMTRPCRRITLHLSQIFLTLGLTFTGAFLLLVPVDDPTAGKVVGGELDDDPVLR